MTQEDERESSSKLSSAIRDSKNSLAIRELEHPSVEKLDKDGSTETKESVVQLRIYDYNSKEDEESSPDVTKEYRRNSTVIAKMNVPALQNLKS